MRLRDDAVRPHICRISNGSRRRAPSTPNPALRNDERALYRAGVLFGYAGTADVRSGQGAHAAAGVSSSAFRGRTGAMTPPIDSRCSTTSLQRSTRRGDASARTRSANRRRDRRSSRVARAAGFGVAAERADATQRDRGSSRDLREREEQLRALRLELQRLKEIDLKPRRPREIDTCETRVTRERGTCLAASCSFGCRTLHDLLEPFSAPRECGMVQLTTAGRLLEALHTMSPAVRDAVAVAAGLSAERADAAMIGALRLVAVRTACASPKRRSCSRRSSRATRCDFAGRCSRREATKRRSWSSSTRKRRRSAGRRLARGSCRV